MLNDLGGNQIFAKEDEIILLERQAYKEANQKQNEKAIELFLKVI